MKNHILITQSSDQWPNHLVCFMIVENPANQTNKRTFWSPSVPPAGCTCILSYLSLFRKGKHLPEQSQNSKGAETVCFLRCTPAAPLQIGSVKFLQICFAKVLNNEHLGEKMRHFFRRTKWMKIPEGNLTVSCWASLRASWRAASYPTLRDGKVVCCSLSANCRRFLNKQMAEQSPKIAHGERLAGGTSP